MTELHVTSEQARSFTLRRQYITEPAATPEEVIDRLVAIQIQYSASFPQTLWSRCPKTKLAWAEQQILRDRTVVKTWCIRSTVHALLLRDYPMMLGAFSSLAWVEAYERFMVRTGRMTRDQMQVLEGRVLEALDEGPLSRVELHRRVPELAAIPYAGWGLDVKSLAYRGKVVFAGSEGAFPRFARTDRWFKEPPEELIEHREAVQALLRRYLSGYGPVGKKDFARWTGLSAKDVSAAFSIVEPELIPVRVEGEKELLFVLSEHEADLRSDAAPPPAAKLLPKFDSLTMGFRNKCRFMREKDLPRVYRIAAQVEAVVLLKGMVAGAWRVQQKGRTTVVLVEPFRRFGIREKSAVEKQALKLSRFLGAKETKLEFAEP